MKENKKLRKKLKEDYWINVNDELPKSQTLDEPDNPYYWVWVAKGCFCRAMYIDGEWWSDYISKIQFPVTHWTKSIEPPIKTWIP